MYRSHVKHIVVSCTQNTTKLQALADMLLLTDHAWPVIHNQPFAVSYHATKDQLSVKVKDFLALVSRIQDCLISQTPSLVELSSGLESSLEAVIEITELCAHISYLLVELFPNCSWSVPGVIDQLRVRKVHLDLRMFGHLLKISSHDQLIPPVLVQIAACLNESLSRLGKFCTSASDTVATALDREQLSSCVKSLSAAGSCVMTSIRVFKAAPNEQHQTRVVAFFDALLHAVSSTAAFITEAYFIGKPATLSKEAAENRKKILGACINVVSSSIQLYNTIKEYAYDTRNPFIRERLVKCSSAISQATVPLLHAVTAASQAQTVTSGSPRLHAS